MKTSTKISLFCIVGVIFLAGGIFYARYEGRNIPQNDGLLSKSIDTESQETPLDTKKLSDRIQKIKVQIQAETNDPDRAIKLRTELQNLEEQLEKASKSQQ